MSNTLYEDIRQVTQQKFISRTPAEFVEHFTDGQSMNDLKMISSWCLKESQSFERSHIEKRWLHELMLHTRYLKEKLHYRNNHHDRKHQ